MSVFVACELWCPTLVQCGCDDAEFEVCDKVFTSRREALCLEVLEHHHEVVVLSELGDSVLKGFHSLRHGADVFFLFLNQRQHAVHPFSLTAFRDFNFDFHTAAC